MRVCHELHGTRWCKFCNNFITLEFSHIHHVIVTLSILECKRVFDVKLSRRAYVNRAVNPSLANNDDDNNDDDDDLNYYNFYNNLLFSILLFISFHKIKYRYICSRWIGDLFVHLSPFGVRLRELASIALRAYLEGT